MFKLRIDNIIIIKASVAFVLEALFGFMIVIIYPIFAWVFFGEGADSMLYTVWNTILWVLMPVLFQTLFNINRFVKAKRNNDIEKLNVYCLAQIALIVIYAPLMTWKYSTGGYHI
jgi:hypothetical protein